MDSAKKEIESRKKAAKEKMCLSLKMELEIKRKKKHDAASAWNKKDGGQPTQQLTLRENT